MGVMAEPQIFKDFCEHNDWDRRDFRRNVRIQVDDEPNYRGEIDALSERHGVIVDCKLIGRYAEQHFGQEESDDMPGYMLVQLAWYRIHKPVERCLLACWLDHKQVGDHYRQYTYMPDSELEETLKYCAEKFWKDHIVKGVPPEVREAGDNKALYQIYPQHQLDLREATEKELEMIQELQADRARIDSLDEATKKLEAKIKRKIAGHEGLTMPNGQKVTWKTTKPSTLTDWQAVAGYYSTDPKFAERVTAHTEFKKGARRFMVPKLKE